VAQRIGLRQFQEQLNRRIAEARTGALEEVRLGVRAGASHFLIRLPDAGEVVAVPKLTPVPRTQPWFRGVGNARGSLYGVVDLAAFLGAPLTIPGPQARLLLVGRRYGANVALLVDGVFGLRKLTELTSDGADSNLPWEGPGFRDQAGTRWRQLEIGSLLAAEQFLQIAA